MAEADTVLITGTTSGLGRALLELYVGRGARVVAVNRRPVPELAALYPTVRFEHVDVRIATDVARLVHQLVEAAELPNVFILNAGINRVDNDEWFDLDAYDDVLATNLHGVLHFVAPLTRSPRGSASRHIVVTSSLAGFVGNPYGLGYHTSKRALSSCFDVWSRMYAGTDLVFQEVVLGPLDTPMFTMADRLPGWMGRVKRLSAGSARGAARAVARFARTRRARLFYPRQAVPLFLGMRLCQAVVPGFFRGRRTLAGAARRGARQDGAGGRK